MLWFTRPNLPSSVARQDGNFRGTGAKTYGVSLSFQAVYKVTRWYWAIIGEWRERSPFSSSAVEVDSAMAPGIGREERGAPGEQRRHRGGDIGSSCRARHSGSLRSAFLRDWTAPSLSFRGAGFRPIREVEGGGSQQECGLDERNRRDWASVVVLFALAARADDEDQARRAYVETKDVPRGAEWDDELAQCRALTHFAVAVGRGRKMAVSATARITAMAS